MTALDRDRAMFKKSVIFSITAHLAVFLLLILSPYLPKPSKKEMIHYVNLISAPGGGGGGGGTPGGEKESIEETPTPKRETLRDLTIPQKLEERSASALRHPVDKPKREIKPKSEKKAVIQKQQRTPSKSAQSQKPSAGSVQGKGSGSGSGVRIGTGSGTGSGFGSSMASKIGLSNFPFTYYLQIIVDRISSNWFQSLVDPGIKGNFQVTVYFRIHKDGQISSLKVEETSRIRSLDLSALRAIQTSAPFPPLPKDYEEEYLGIHLIFEHSK
ncbi:MAG: TonB family protein [Candidatus Aminicenantes bacterium]|nr:MAG: TonB family protein [Candidatus Aminicenantes bacterium]